MTDVYKQFRTIGIRTTNLLTQTHIYTKGDNTMSKNGNFYSADKSYKFLTDTSLRNPVKVRSIGMIKPYPNIQSQTHWLLIAH